MISDLRNSDSNDVNQPDENGVTWEFVFLGANQDAIQAGGSLGMSQRSSMTYNATAEGSATMFSSLTRSMTNYRTQSLAYSFSEEDRKAQENVKTNTSGTTRTPKSFKAIPDLVDTTLDIDNAKGVDSNP